MSDIGPLGHLVRSGQRYEWEELVKNPTGQPLGEKGLKMVRNLHREARFCSCEGYNHTMAWNEKGEVYSWGSNLYGQLGIGNTWDADKPTLVTGLLAKKVMEVVCGACHSVARTEDGQLWLWGDSHYGQTCLKPENQACQLSPVKVPIADQKVVSVSCRLGSTFAVVESGQVYAWGNNVLCDLGVKKKNRFICKPSLVMGLEGVKIVFVSCGFFHTLALSEKGEIYAWGTNYSQQIDKSKDTMILLPRRIYTSTKVQDIMACSVSSIYVESGKLNRRGEAPEPYLEHLANTAWMARRMGCMNV